MKIDNLDKIIDILNKAIQSENHHDDFELIQKLKLMINDLNENTDIDNLDTIQKQFNYLEIKYNDIFDLSYYFDPIIIQLKKLIHNKEIQELRKRKKKEGI